MSSILTFTSDFGLRDWFVGTVKGVVLGGAPATRIVDITHEVPHGDIGFAAFALAAAFPYFPEGTIHLAVVDPGVGSEREALALRTRRGVFVGPDNGILPLALGEEKVTEARHLKNAEIFLPRVSETFHGRDIFAPAAAFLCGGGAFEALGPPAREWVCPGRPAAVPVDARTWRGEVLYVDRYGNAITNLPCELVPAPPDAQTAVVIVPGDVRAPVRPFYSAAARGAPVAVPGSTGYLEVAVYQGSAASAFGLAPGTPVRLALAPE